MADALHVRNHRRVVPGVADARRVEAAGDGDGFPVAGDDPGGLPGRMLSDHHVDGRIGHGRAFPDKGDPHVDVLLGEDADGLLDFLPDHTFSVKIPIA